MNGGVFSRARVARSISRFILLGVLLPNVAYLGHWGVTEATVTPGDVAQAQKNTDEHALHCHTGPSKCAGPQATVGALNVNEDSGLITPPNTVKPTIESPSEIAPEPPYSRLLQPPQAV